jgi:putative ABC transport system permease protein
VLLADVRVALRNLRSEPGYTAAAVVTLAMTIGATTAIFSAVHAVLLNPGGIHAPESLVMCWARDEARQLGVVELSYRNFEDWAAHNRSFASAAAVGSSTWPAVLDGRGDPVRLAMAGVSVSFFSTLGAAPILGRVFVAEDDLPNAPRVVVLSHSTWATRFGGDRHVVGTVITFDGAPHTVAGVMPPDFDFPRATDVWTPIVPILARSAGSWSTKTLETVGVLFVVGRLRDHVTAAMARDELDALAARIEREGGARRFGSAVVVTPFLDYSLGPVRQALWALFGAVGVLLLIGCANVSGLMLTRASFRRRDHAIRLALGATPAAIGRLWVVETAVLSAAGGGLGILGAHWMAKAMVAIAPQNLPRLTSVEIDATVAAFTCAVVALAALLCGAGPLRHALGSNLLDGLNGAARTSATRSVQRSRSALVTLEIGLAIALMIAAGLVVRSFVNLRQIRLGFAPSGVVTMKVSPRTTRPPNEWIAELLARVSTMPGVEAAGAVYLRPLALGPIGQETSVILEGQPDSPDVERQNPALNYQVATAGYFTAMHIELKRGRLFTDEDQGRSARVALVGESTARRLWPGQDPVGKRLLMPTFERPVGRRAWRIVVGVVADVRYRGVDDVRLDVYDPASQSPLDAGDLVIRTSGDPLRLSAAIQAAARALDPRVLVSSTTTMDAVVARAVAPWRFSVWVFGLFAALAVALATGGLFSVVSLDVGRRRRELAVRVALGAQRGDILWSVLLPAMQRLLAGVALGVSVGAVASGVLRSLLFGVEPLDATTYVTVTLLVCGVVMAASYFPARRAAGADAPASLRCE